jgi:hypothetical protein
MLALHLGPTSCLTGLIVEPVGVAACRLAATRITLQPGAPR